MMGRLNREQGQLFYSFCLDEAVPADHIAREIAAVLDLSWVHAKLAPYYSHLGRPSIDPVLMIRMLIVGYVFAITTALAELHAQRARNRAESLADRYRIADPTPRSAMPAPGSSGLVVPAEAGAGGRPEE